jgi:hypothetical protein
MALILTLVIFIDSLVLIIARITHSRGSLSSGPWLAILRRQGLDAGGTQYLKLGLVLTPSILRMAALTLYGRNPPWHQPPRPTAETNNPGIICNMAPVMIYFVV